MAGVVYLDSSALVKLVAAEAESDDLAAALKSLPPRQSSSVIAEVEVSRVLLRSEGGSQLQPRVLALLDSLELIEADIVIRRLAISLNPPSLGSLDAIHLASALRLGDELSAFVTYDRRLFAAASAIGLAVLAPGQAKAKP